MFHRSIKWILAISLLLSIFGNLFLLYEKREKITGTSRLTSQNIAVNPEEIFPGEDLVAFPNGETWIFVKYTENRFEMRRKFNGESKILYFAAEKGDTITLTGGQQIIFLGKDKHGLYRFWFDGRQV